MKTFKIRYEFFNRTTPNTGGFWDIGSAVVLASDDYQASELFYSQVEELPATILSCEELTTPQIVWAY